MKLFKASFTEMPSHELALRERGVSLNIPITHLNTPTVFEAHNGQLGSVIKLAGISSDTASSDDLNSARNTWHHAVSMLDESFCLYTYTIRKKLNVKLKGKFDNDFCRDLDARYQAKFNAEACYSNDLYLVVIYRGLNSGKVGKANAFFQKLSQSAMKSLKDEWRKESLAKLGKAVPQLLATLSRFLPERVGDNDGELGHSELMSFLGMLVNGGYHIPFKLPEGHVGQYLPATRISFGRTIAFEGQKTRYAAMLTIKRYPDSTMSLMCDPLLHLNAEFIATHSFSIEPQAVSTNKVQKQYNKLVNSGDQALSQLEELGDCVDGLASGHFKAGLYHHSLMLLCDSPAALDIAITDAIKHYADSGIVAFHDVLGQQAMFWAQLPCNQKLIVRSAFLTSYNFIDFFPLHNYRTGYRDKNHLGGAVSIIETPSKTPMYFNYHTKGSGKKNDLTPGHAAIIGGNGSGKTVIECFMDAQMTRYGGRSFFFDRDRGTEIYVRACGGQYAILSPDHPEDVQFNPFSLVDTPQNRQFLKSWLAELVRDASEEEIPADIQARVGVCVDYAYSSLQAEHRCLANAVKLLPINFPRWHSLNKWINKGDYAYLFDHKNDALSLDLSKIGFDLTELMKLPEKVMTVVMMYLFHRIELSLDGSRVSIYLAEGWQYLNHAYWIKKLSSWLPTLRKLNCHIVLDTQSPKTVANSPISAEYLDNSATSIFFCNDKADFDVYQKFNITASEFNFIKNTPKECRLFLYKQGHESAICKLDLSGMGNSLSVLSGNKETVEKLAKLRARVGNDPKKWLPLFYEEPMA